MDEERSLARLVLKYNQTGPRYTSYPTPPNWTKDFGPQAFEEKLKQSCQKKNPLSLYFHIPFCETRCAFCACSVIATKRHEVATPYLRALTKEINRVASVIDREQRVEQIHWGGGTPTYLSSEQIQVLYEWIRRHFTIGEKAEISIEIDPRVTSTEQLKTLRGLGFNRVSLGVQDFEAAVQAQTGRIQSEEQTRQSLETCRELHFESINIDLIYGLPKQTPDSFQRTLQKILHLNPDRIALFNFAYVPWMHVHQGKISQEDLPSPVMKLNMFRQAIETFQGTGYAFIGLDHFAKKEDELAKAQREETMVRNFQGYTTKANCDLIGMGVTAISSVEGSFAQNAKKLKDYEDVILEGRLATELGYVLTPEDKIRQWVMRELFCHQAIRKEKFEKTFSIDFDTHFQKELQRLKNFEQDGLVNLDKEAWTVTPLGRLFLRNIGMVFDAYLRQSSNKFSRVI